MTTTTERMEELVDRYFDGVASAAELMELQEVLRASPEARRLFIRTARLDSALYECFHQMEADSLIAGPEETAQAKHPALPLTTPAWRPFWTTWGERAWGPVGAVLAHAALLVLLLRMTVFHSSVAPQPAPVALAPAVVPAEHLTLDARPGVPFITWVSELPPPDVEPRGTIDTDLPNIVAPPPAPLSSLLDPRWAYRGQGSATPPVFAGRIGERRMELLRKSVGSHADELDKSVARAEHWLMERQAPSGAWNESDPNKTLETTALAVLALLARLDEVSESEAKNGPIRNGLYFLIGGQNPDGSFGKHKGYPNPSTQALATYALAEARAFTRAPTLESALTRAIDRSLELQGSDGLWVGNAPGADNGSAWATAWYVEALQVARLTGHSVPEIDTALTRARDALARFAQPASGPSYYGEIGTKANPPLPHLVAALHTLQITGEGGSPAAVRGIRAVESIPIRWDDAALGWPPVAWYHLTQIHRRAGDAYWTRWYNRLGETLVSQQKPDGHWEHPSTHKAGYSSQYDTALCSLALGACYRFTDAKPPTVGFVFAYWP